MNEQNHVGLYIEAWLLRLRIQKVFGRLQASDEVNPTRATKLERIQWRAIDREQRRKRQLGA